MQKPGDVWLVPTVKKVNLGTDPNFRLEVHCNTGRDTLCALGIDIGYDSTLLKFNDSPGIVPRRFGSLISNTSIPGVVKVSGFSISGTGAGSDIVLFDVNFISLSGGISNISLLVDNFVNAKGLNIGTPNGADAMVVIAGPTTEPVVRTPSPTREPLTRHAFRQDNGNEGIISIEAEDFNSKTEGSGHDWRLVSKPAGYSGKGAMQVLPDIGTVIRSTDTAASPHLGYNVYFENIGIHYIWLRGNAAGNLASDSCSIGLDGAPARTAADMSLRGASFWLWTRVTSEANERATIDVRTPGYHTLDVRMAEDGIIIDKIVLCVDPSYIPAGTGPSESPLQ